MAENLNTKPQTGKSWCYDNDDFYCKEYGRRYNWEAAKTVCPAGWHLPSIGEWRLLVETVGGYDVAGKKLKAKNGWYNNGNGTDEYKFSALPDAPVRRSCGTYTCLCTDGVWWTATESEWRDKAYCRYMESGTDLVSEFESIKGCGYSVRCVKDE